MISGFIAHLSDVLGNTETLVLRLQKPFAGDHLNVAAQDQR